jgi:hypothetical protein
VPSATSSTPEHPALLLDAEQGLEELLLGDETLAHQDLSERLARVVRPGRVDAPPWK